LAGFADFAAHDFGRRFAGHRDLLFDDALLPGPMDIACAQGRHQDRIITALVVVLEREMLRLVDITGPVGGAFLQATLIADIAGEGEVPHIF
jgi:hypothetical protein